MIVFVSGCIVVVGVLILALCLYLGNVPTRFGGEKPNTKKFTRVGIGVAAVCIIAAFGIMICLPQYYVYQQNKQGEAELARAEQNRQIAVQEAKAKEESAQSLANARIIEAQGISEANRIIGNSLTNNDAYIHYLWIEALKESKDQVIYVPTEAGIPITESARFIDNDFRKVKGIQ